MAHSRTRALARRLAVLLLAAASGPAFGGDAAPPAAPLGVTAVAASPAQIVLAWVAPADEGAVAGYEVLRDGEQVSFTAGLTASQSGLSPWREYCYTVRAYDAAGRKSAPSSPACARTLDVEPPTTPKDVVARGVSETEIEIAWKASTDDGKLAWYEVRREEIGTLAATETRTARERFLEPWRQYCYTVRARDEAGNWSPPSPPACARTLYKSRPTAPSSVAARAKSDTEIELTWREATSAVGLSRYEVVNGGRVLATSPALEARVGELDPASEYCFDVVAVDTAGNRSAPAAGCATTLDLKPPSPPQEVVLAVASPSEILLAWAPSSDDVGVAGYEVVRADGRLATVKEPRAVDERLAPAQEYCYTVRAFDAAGNRSPDAGPFCARTPVAGTPAAPRNLTAATPSRKAVALRWDASPQPGVVYRVFADNDRAIGVTKSTAFTAPGLKPGERRCFTVSAVDEQGRMSPRTPATCITLVLDQGTNAVSTR